MDWLSQNWLWIALGVGAIFFMSRMGGCGMSHASGHHHEAGSEAKSPAAGAPGPAGSDPDSQQRRPHRHGCC